MTAPAALLQGVAPEKPADSGVGRSRDEAPQETLERWGWLAGRCAHSLLGLSDQSVTGMEVAASGAVLIDPLATGDMPMIAAGDRVRIERTVTVSRSRDELYRSWRGSDRLSLLAESDLGGSDPGGSDAQQDSTKGSSDPTPLFAHMLDWDVTFAAERWPEWLVWRSHPDALVEQVLSVRLTCDSVGQGTIVQLSYECAMTGGPSTRGLGPLRRRLADARTRANLHRFTTMTDGEATERDSSTREDGADQRNAA